MASFNKFNHFALHLGSGEHKLQAAGDTLKIYLTNNTPDADADVVKTDLAGITEQNGYAVADIQNDYTEAAGVGTLTGVDVTFTASGGSFGPFRYVVLYNSDPTTLTDPLIGWWDYGASITVLTGETFKADFGASILTIT